MRRYMHAFSRTVETLPWVDWDDTTRTVTTYDEAGTVASTRPYTADENASADVAAVAHTEATNEAAIRDRARTALTANRTFLALAAPTNVQVLAQTKLLTRECTALIRLAVRALDNIDGT